MPEQPLQLIVQQEGRMVKVLALTMPVLSFGRAPDSGLSLEHPLVSRRHAELRMGPQSLILTDLGSANGTFVGEQRLLPNQPHILTAGTTFRIGPFHMTVRLPVEASSSAPEEQEPEYEEPDSIVDTQALQAVTTVQNQVSRTEQPVPRLPTDTSRSIYPRFLPDIYQENDFLRRFLMIFEDIWEPLEQRQDYIEMYLDPRTCPTSFLPWFANWLGLPLNPHWPEARMRRLLSQGMELYRWRGTPYGLTRMIEVCTGVTPLIRESSSQAFVFHIRITLPANAEQEGVTKELIEDLIKAHKPAHAGYILEVVGTKSTASH